jgi:hypothetical protein
MKAWQMACVVAGLALSGCGSLSELEQAELTLSTKQLDLNATQHEIDRVKANLSMLPKDSPPVIDLTRRVNLLDRKQANLQSDVIDAETQLAALKQPVTEIDPPLPPAGTIPPVVPTPAVPGQPTVDPNGLPIPSPPAPTTTIPVPTPPAPPTPTPTPPTPAPTPTIPAPIPPVPVPLPGSTIPPVPGSLTPPPPPPIPNTPPASSTPPAAQVSGLRVSQFKVFDNPATGIKYVVGDLHNEAAKPFSRIKVEFRLYDADDKPLGTTSDTRVTEVAPGTMWPFRALIQNDAAARAELAGVSILP